MNYTITGRAHWDAHLPWLWHQEQAWEKKFIRQRDQFIEHMIWGTPSSMLVPSQRTIYGDDAYQAEGAYSRFKIQYSERN